MMSYKYFSLCFFNDKATTEIYTYGHTLSLHDALPILGTIAILGCIYLCFSLPTKTEVFFLCWNALGLVVYFIYGRPRAGKATKAAVDPEALPEKPVLPAD